MSEIKNDLLNGVFWSAIEKYSGLIVSIFVSMILARILSPEDFGVVAIATVLIQFLQIFCNMGIAPAIIQYKDLTRSDLDNIYSFSIYAGLFLSIVMLCASWAVGLFFSKQSLIYIMQLLTVNLFFSSANMVPNALMAKNKKFKDLARRTLLLQFLTGSISIVAAIQGLGLYSLLISPIFTSIGIFVYNRRFFKLSFKYNCSSVSVRKIFSYSIYQLAFEFSNFFSRNLDKLIIGKILSTTELGFYEKSYRLMQLPLNNVSSVINPVIQPVMCDLQDDIDNLSDKYLKLISIIALISFPISCLMYTMSKEIIYVLYGEQWLPAVSPMMILSLSIPTQMILATSGAIWQTCNCTKQMFWSGLINTAVTISGFIISISFGGNIDSIAMSWTLTSIINFFNTYLYMYKFVFKSSFFAFIKNLLYPFLSLFVGIFLCTTLQIPSDNNFIAIIIKTIVISFESFIIYRLGGIDIQQIFKFKKI